MTAHSRGTKLVKCLGQKEKKGVKSPLVASTMGWSSCQEKCSHPLAVIYQIFSLSFLSPHLFPQLSSYGGGGGSGSGRSSGFY